jgi:hypothetical protein
MIFSRKNQAAGSPSPLAGEATRLNERSEFSRSGEGAQSEADNLHTPPSNLPPQGGKASPAASLVLHNLYPARCEAA